jgi:hypothetical protein
MTSVRVFRGNKPGATVAVDVAGRELAVGDVVAYPIAVGRSAMLAQGVVLEIGRPKKSYGMSAREWSIKLEVPAGEWSIETMGYVATGKKAVTVHFPERLVVTGESVADYWQRVGLGGGPAVTGGPETVPNR